MIRGLREGTAAQFRTALGQTLAAGKRGTAVGEGEDRGMPGGGLVPAQDHVKVAQMAETPLARAAAAADLEVHHYGRRSHATLPRPSDPVASARAGGFPSARSVMDGRRAGRSKAPEFRSHSQDSAELGDHPDLVFGAVGERAGPHTGGLSLGSKCLRPTVLADGGVDVLGSSGGSDGLGAAMSEAPYRA